MFDRMIEEIISDNGALFECAIQCGCGIKEFAGLVMESHTANDMLTKFGFPNFCHETAHSTLEMLYMEYGLPVPKYAADYDEETADRADWLGRVYKRLEFATDLSPREIYRRVPIELIDKYYDRRDWTPDVVVMKELCEKCRIKRLHIG